MIVIYDYKTFMAQTMFNDGLFNATAKLAQFCYELKEGRSENVKVIKLL